MDSTLYICKVGIGLHDTWSHTYSHVCGSGFRIVVVCFGKLSTDPRQTMFVLSSHSNAIAVCAMQVNKSVAEYKSLLSFCKPQASTWPLSIYFQLFILIFSLKSKVWMPEESSSFHETPPRNVLKKLKK